MGQPARGQNPENGDPEPREDPIFRREWSAASTPAEKARRWRLRTGPWTDPGRQCWGTEGSHTCLHWTQERTGEEKVGQQTKGQRAEHWLWGKSG